MSYIFTPRDFDGPSFSGHVHFHSAPLRIRRESTCCAPVASGDESISNGRKQVRRLVHVLRALQSPRRRRPPRVVQLFTRVAALAVIHARQISSGKRLAYLSTAT